jgi:hypothetical protein
MCLNNNSSYGYLYSHINMSTIGNFKSTVDNFMSIENNDFKINHSKVSFSLITGIILSAIFVVVGIYMMINDDSYKYFRVKGVIVTPSCVKASTTYDKDGYPTDVYKCNIVVAYKINGEVFSRKMYVTGSNNYEKDESIDLMVHKNNYDNVRLAFMDGTTVGCIFITVALIVISLAYLNYYVTYKYKKFLDS